MNLQDIQKELDKIASEMKISGKEASLGKECTQIASNLENMLDYIKDLLNNLNLLSGNLFQIDTYPKLIKPDEKKYDMKDFWGEAQYESDLNDYYENARPNFKIYIEDVMEEIDLTQLKSYVDLLGKKLPNLMKKIKTQLKDM